MNKFLTALSFCISTLLFSNYSNAHCSGGHKEIKETSDESSEENTKEATKNKLS